jgi:hypothetical protein
MMQINAFVVEAFVQLIVEIETFVQLIVKAAGDWLSTPWLGFRHRSRVGGVSLRKKSLANHVQSYKPFALDGCFVQRKGWSGNRFEGAMKRIFYGSTRVAVEFHESLHLMCTSMAVVEFGGHGAAPAGSDGSKTAVEFVDVVLQLAHAFLGSYGNVPHFVVSLAVSTLDVVATAGLLLGAIVATVVSAVVVLASTGWRRVTIVVDYQR